MIRCLPAAWSSLSFRPRPPHFHSPAQLLTRHPVAVPIQGADPTHGQVERRLLAACLFVSLSDELLGEHPEKIPLFGVQLEAAFEGGIVEHLGPVAYRQQGRVVFLSIHQFAVDEGRDERERGEGLPVGGGVVGQEILLSSQVGNNGSEDSRREGYPVVAVYAPAFWTSL